MIIVSNVLRKLGYKIIKIYDLPAVSKKPKSFNEKISKEPLIKKTAAIEALTSVGRKHNVHSFTFYERPNKSSEKMEELENTWWNANGKLIEKVWVFSEFVNTEYRKPYISKASAFFRKANAKNKILDLGCGSGWFGRMIADTDLEYHGIDFSSTQIEIANNEKRNALNKEFLNYYCISDFKKIENIDSFTGIVIHAFLHHLYWDELNSLFSDLVKILPNGCKFFITEPIYPDQNNYNVSNIEINNNNDFISAYRLKLNLIKNELIEKGVFDYTTEDELISIAEESNNNGFFFSPKEVPFKLNEFQVFLKQYFQVENYYHCGVLNLETAQLIEKIKNDDLKKQYSNLLFPIANSLDALLIHNNYFETNPDKYLFTVFECTLKKF